MPKLCARLSLLTFDKMLAQLLYLICLFFIIYAHKILKYPRMWSGTCIDMLWPQGRDKLQEAQSFWVKLEYQTQYSVFMLVLTKFKIMLPKVFLTKVSQCCWILISMRMSGSWFYSNSFSVVKIVSFVAFLWRLFIFLSY